MKNWYRPVVEEFLIDDLVKEVKAKARSGGGGTGGGTGGCTTCWMLEKCDSGLHCDKIAIL